MDMLEKNLCYVFKNKDYLTEALTHSSYANENRKSGAECNERLEFLGDSILGFIVADYLYSREPKISEGQMTRLRAELVCEKSLDAVAAHLDLGKYLKLGKGEEKGGGRTRPSILADAVEAVIAAVYIDGGLDEAKSLIYREIIAVFENNGAKDVDHKSRLQEIIQRENGRELKYELVGESGPDHAKVFEVNALLDGKVIGTGRGKSKKDAEQAAAKQALEGME